MSSPRCSSVYLVTPRGKDAASRESPGKAQGASDEEDGAGGGLMFDGYTRCEPNLSLSTVQIISNAQIYLATCLVHVAGSAATY